MSRAFVHLMIILAMACPLVLAADERGEERAEIRTETVASCDRAPAPSRQDRGFLIESLHAARTEEDMDLYRALEAQLSVPPQTGGETGDAVMIKRTSTTVAGIGDHGGLPAGPKLLGFDEDIDVRGVTGQIEVDQDMASDSNGNLYVVMLVNPGAVNNFAQVYKSEDGGNTWFAFNYVRNPTAIIESPSLAVGEGSPGDLLLLAYVVDDQTNPRYPEVATQPLTGGAFTIHSVSVFGLWDYVEPVIWTDSSNFSIWFGYLTAGAHYEGSATNVNVSFWRSTNAVDWSSQTALLGNTDADTWLDPDGSFGTSYYRLFVTSFNDTDDTLYVRYSDDFGATFGPTIPVGLVSPDPIRAVDPEIEAAVDEDSVMMVFTMGGSTSANIGQTYSVDAGTSWPNPLWLMDGSDVNRDEWAPTLTANEGGGSWHVAWTAENNYVWATSRRQDLSTFWEDHPMRVNRGGSASAVHPKKSIASDWTSDRPSVVWSDFRVGGEYNTYFATTGFSVFADDFELGNTSEWSAATP